ncbi:tripartite tricarboxylate transporter substrate binding protein BugE [Comamonas humi]
MINRRHCVALALAASCGAALAQSAYPSKPIRLIVPFAAGGTTDIIARVVAEPLAKALGQPVVVDNRGGGGGTVGAAEAARAQPDGYVLSIATVSTTATNPAVNPKMPYNVQRDFTPIINIAATPNVIAVHPSFPAKDYQGFIAELKKHPGKYSYATPGTGSIAHLLMEMLKGETHVDVQHVPYRGAGPALNDTVAGQVNMIFDNLPSALPFIKEKRLNAIVVAAPQRVAGLEGVPTFKEVGAPMVNRLAYYGVVGPRNLPAEIVDKVNAAMRKALEDPAVRKRIEDTGSVILGNTPEQFAQQMKDEYAAYKAVVDKQGITLEQ